MTTWIQRPGDIYVVTGVDLRGRRFRYQTSIWLQARSINVYRGSRWLVRDGKRTLLERIYN
jgi:hypothetical protein